MKKTVIPRGILKCTILVLLFVIFAVGVKSQILPDPPNIGILQQELCMPDTTGYVTHTVGPSAFNDYKDLQQALNDAQYGWILKLEAGATFNGGKGLFGYVLPNKHDTNSKWIIIMGSRCDLISPSCQRIHPDSATGNSMYPTQRDALPKITTNPASVPRGQDDVIYTADSANHYRIIGVEVEVSTTNSVYKQMLSLITLSHNLAADSARYYGIDTIPSAQPNHIIIDHCYIHGSDTAEVRSGVVCSGNYIGIINSEISNNHESDLSGYESHGILLGETNGPFAFLNNFIESSTENLLCGGEKPQNYGTVPSDIIIKWNLFSKRLTWDVLDPSYRGKPVCTKNLLEFKNARRVLVEGNIFENQWNSYCQNWDGVAIEIRSNHNAIIQGNVQADDSTQVNNVTVRNNIIRNCVHGFGLDGWYHYQGCQPICEPPYPIYVPIPPNALNKILISNNLLYNLGGSPWETKIDYPHGGIHQGFMTIAHPGRNITIDHNTIFNKNWGGILYFEVPRNENFYFQNNIAFVDTNQGSAPGILGSSSFSGLGTGYSMSLTNPSDSNYEALEEFAGPSTTIASRFNCNVFINDEGLDINDNSTVWFPYHNSIHYPPGILFPGSLAAVGFINPTYTAYNADYHNLALSDSSKYHKAACDGKDMGVDMVALDAAMLPVLSILASAPVTVCYGDSTQLSSSGATTYSWSPSTGLSSASVANPKASPATSTTYSVTGSTGCCSETVTVTVTVRPVLKDTAFQSASASCGMSNGIAVSNASGGSGGNYAYNWSNPTTSATNNNIPAGIYTVTVTDGNGCTASSTIIIANTGFVMATTSVLSNVSCKGGNNGEISVSVSGGTSSYTYSWSNTENTQSDSGLTKGTYTVSVTQGNCLAISVASITEPSTSVMINGVTVTSAACGSTGGSAVASASGGTGILTYSWSNTTTDPIASGLPVGIYTITVNDSNHCQVSSTVSIPGSSLSVSVQSVQNICQGQTSGGTIYVTSSGNVSYAWSNGGSSWIDSGLSVGSYTVTATDLGGCSATTSASIAVIAAPVANAGLDETIAKGQNVQLSASGGISYLWSPAASLNNDSIYNPIASPAQTTSYRVIVTDINNCSAADSVLITVGDCGVSIPSAFSPNGDNKNDFECVYGGCIETMDLLIFDRWGEKVFETTSPSTCWDGTYRGKKEDAGVFVYEFQATLTSGEKITKSGNISLIR